MAGRQISQYVKIAAAQVGFKTLFNREIAQVEDPIKVLGLEVESDSESEEYDWFGDVPGLSLWTDDRVLGMLRGEMQKIVNYDFASGIRIDKNTIMDDKLKRAEIKIRQLAAKAGMFTSYMIGRMLLNGFAGDVEPAISDGKSYDGVYFFSNSHQDGDGPTNDNLMTDALSDDAYNSARVLMAAWRDEQNRNAFSLNPDTLVVGKSNEREALEITKANVRAISNGPIDNVMQGTARVIVSPALVGSYANYWFLADSSKPIKPIIVQRRQAPQFAYVNSEQNDDVFMRKQIKAGADARYGFGYGWPCTCIGSTGAG